MRFVKVIVVVLLLGSLLGNFILYTKYRNGRPIFSINGQGITKSFVDGYLAQSAGPNVKAILTERVLTDQEAKRLNLTPTPAEVDEAFNEQKELRWDFARKMAENPWYVGETKAQIEQAIDRNRIRAKDVTVSDDEIKSEYQAHSALYDTPNKARCYFAVVLDESRANEILQLMQKNDPPISPTVIMQNAPRAVTFLGDNFKYTFVQPFGDTKVNQVIFNMKPDEVKKLPPQDLARQGAKALIVKMIKIEPGHKADLSSPKIKERIRLSIALQRSKPWPEILSTLFANMKFESEDPNDKRNIELQLFPDRAMAR